MSADRTVSPRRRRPTDRSTPGLALALVVVLALVGSLLGAESATAQSAGGSVFDTDTPAARVVVQTDLAERFEILETRSGLVLRPLEPTDDYRLIEVDAAGVFVDGTPVDETALRRFVDRDAVAIRSLRDAWAADRVAGETPSPSDSDRVEADEDSRLARRQAELERIEREAAAAARLAEERVEALERAAERAREALADEEALVEEEQRLREIEEEEARAAREAREEREAERIDREEAEGSQRSEQLFSFSAVVIEEDEVVQEVVVIGAPLVVHGRVLSDATVIAGPGEIYGRVNGDVTVVGGPLTVGEGAEIRGDAVTVGGSIDRESGSRIRGEIVEAGGFHFGRGRDDRDRDQSSDTAYDDEGVFDFQWREFVERITFTLLLVLLTIATVWLARPWVDRTERRLRAEPAKSALAGLAVLILLPPVLLLVLILLVVTLVGIPVALLLAPVVAVVLGLMLLLGFTAAAKIGGTVLSDRFALVVGTALTLALGVALINGWSILGELLGILPWPLKLLAAITIIFGFSLKFAVWLTGLGAVTLELLDSRRPPGSAADAGSSYGAGGSGYGSYGSGAYSSGSYGSGPYGSGAASGPLDVPPPPPPPPHDLSNEAWDLDSEPTEIDESEPFADEAEDLEAEDPEAEDPGAEDLETETDLRDSDPGDEVWAEPNDHGEFSPAADEDPLSDDEPDREDDGTSRR